MWGLWRTANEGPLFPPPRKTILIVDDTPSNIDIIQALLQETYATRVATNGALALRLARAEPIPSLILLDIMMPEMDGYQVCATLQADARTRDIPIIFLTANTEIESEVKGFGLGAVDYITKPVCPQTLRARVTTHLTLVEARDFLRNQAVLLEEQVEERTREIAAVQAATIIALGSLAETRDNETGNHLRRTQHYVRALALKLQDHDHYRGVLTDDMVRALYRSAPLHDIGKVGIPDRILLKPGKLTSEEFEVMKTHAVLGRDAIARAELNLDAKSDFLALAGEIAFCHHEKWDGSGYPRGLAGGQIPISARLMAVADVYDALISKRVYKKAFSHEKAVEIIREGRGTHFDPDVVEAFEALAGEFHRLAQEFSDTDEELQRKARLADLAV